MRVDEFVERFLSLLKVELHTIPYYARHVVLLVREFKTMCYTSYNTIVFVAQVLPNSC